MSFVIAAPEFLTAAAMDLASIGSTVSAASAAASAPTVAILAAGADEVSIAVAALFGMHGQAYQALSVQASAFHQQKPASNPGWRRQTQRQRGTRRARRDRAR